MELPILEPAPVVAEHAAVCGDLLENQCQVRHVQHDLTGRIGLPHTRMTNIARCVLDSADNTNLARFFSQAPWREDEVNRRRIRFMRQQTTPHRRRRRASLLALDDTLCEPVGSLFAYVDRHDNHGDGTDPLAHHPVTSLQVSGPVRCPVGWRLYRRDEALTQGEMAVARHCPELKIPRERQARNRLHKQVDPVWLQDPECRARHERCRTNIALAIDLGEEAIRHKVPFGVVVCDAWSLAEALVQVLARRRTDWMSLRNTNRLLETARFHLREAHGWTLKRPGPHLAIEKRVPLIPATAYRPVQVHGQTYGCFTLGVRIPGMGTVRIVVSFAHEQLTGRDVALVTNRADWSAAKIMGLSLPRWPTETFSQDSQGHLGFNAYRMRRIEAMGKHWCVVFVADSLWHLTCLPTGSERTRGLIQPMGDACRQQGRALLHRLWLFVHEQLSRGVQVDQLLAQILAKPRAIVLV
jgi:DDE superfamily endonuclease